MLSRMSSPPCTWLYDLGSLKKQAKKMQPAQDVVGEAVITWPGVGRCRRTIPDVDEPSKKRQLFIFGVPWVRLLSNEEGRDSESRRRSSSQGACSNATFFPIMVRRDHRNLKTLSIRVEPMRCNRTEWRTRRRLVTVTAPACMSMTLVCFVPAASSGASAQDAPQLPSFLS